MLDPIHSLTDLAFLAQDVEGNGRALWFIAIVIILAIQHIAEKLKEKRANEINEQRGQFEEGQEEEFDWEEEVEGYHEPKPANETLMEFFRSINQPQSDPVPPPPPPVASPPPAARKTVAKPAGSGLSHEEQRALEALKERGSLTQTHRQRMHASAEHTALGKMLRSPDSLRNAFILKEILEPPLAAREDPNPHPG